MPLVDHATKVATALSSATCVVTGGLGFVGSNLARALAVGGARVRVVDALVPQHGGDRRNLSGLAHDAAARVEVVETDIGSAAAADALDGADVVFNVAGQVSHHASMTDPLRDLELNVRSHLSFLEHLRQVTPGVRVVLTSTRQVYGRATTFPVAEDHPTAPLDVNGIDKLACEQLHLLYGRVHGLRPTVLRLTNVFGPRQNLLKDDLGVLPVFVRRALRGETIQLYGDGAQRRDCLMVDDVVRALVLAATSDAAVGAIANVGNVRSWTLREIAETLVELTGNGAGVRCIPWPSEQAKIDIGDFQCDIAAAQRLFGWSPLVELSDGLAHTIAFYREHPWYLSST